MQRTRLASVSYLNALPLTWGITRGRLRDRYDVTMAPPFECARLLQEGLVDIALIPSIELVRSSGLTPVPGTGVASGHEVRSVLLISRKPPGAIRSLALDTNSRTSVGLARLILNHRYQCRPRLEVMGPDLRAMLSTHDAALLIGDAALRATLAMPEEAPYVLDLAREWNELTGMPFVFALWACRPVMDAGQTREVLEHSLQEGLMSIERIAVEESLRTGLPAEVISTYLRENIQYRIGRAESDSLRVFFRMCREAGLLSESVPEAATGTRAARLLGTADGTGKPSELRPLLPHGR